MGRITLISNVLKPSDICLYIPMYTIKLDGLRPGTIIPRAINPPAIIQVKKLASTLPSIAVFPKYKRIVPPINEAIKMIISRGVRPSFPASLQRAGIVPTIHPIKNQRIIVSKFPNK